MTPQKVGIIPFTFFGGAGRSVGSTFLRVDGLVKHCHDFEVWKHGHAYRGLIFQKAYWTEMMTVFRGPKILDLCDVDWLQGEVDIIRIGNLVHAITCSSEALTALLKSYFPGKIVEYIPDRLDFSLFPAPRADHEGDASRAIWFGFLKNAYATLKPLAPALKALGIKLTIVSEQQYAEHDEILSLNPTLIRYDQSTIYRHIGDADITLNPRAAGAAFRYKSNNKSVISWKLGVPVACTSNDLYRLFSGSERQKEAVKMRRIVEKDYNILSSASAYEHVFSLIQQRYF